MTKIDFFLGLLFLALIYLFRSKIINPYIQIKDIYLQYIFIFIFLIYIIFGTLYTFEETKKTFSNVNDTFEQKELKEKPHRWWDIDTYW